MSAFGHWKMENAQTWGAKNMTILGFFAVVFAIYLGNILSELTFIMFLGSEDPTDPKSHDDWER